MSGMRERAELIGGELEFLPAPGGNARALTVPLAGRPATDAALGRGALSRLRLLGQPLRRT